MVDDFDSGMVGLQPVRALVGGNQVDFVIPRAVLFDGTQYVAQGTEVLIAVAAGGIAAPIMPGQVVVFFGLPCWIAAIYPWQDEVNRGIVGVGVH
ncbi:hypothetical protein BHC44_02260 [Snodgrassella alvi]|uniref:Uncharacterized protein n=1 Tax=Snodgrassella alvi TaxID=1196083 RepID=A0A2N9XVH5_9NEIS|nr:hypothetical protein BHC49_10380 [Snodgrassella alvi]PIT55776.1 hypothetical protein BHC44_02260 [Snodgrassella alvi]